MASKTLGQRLREGREKMGWSQTQVAEISGISNTNISNYERDFRKPDLQTLVHLASLYGQNLDYLVKGEATHIDGVMRLWERETRVIRGHFETSSGLVKTEMVMIPIVSQLLPQKIGLDFDDIDGYLPVIAQELDLGNYDYFAFVVQDDAMIHEGIRENTIVIVRQADTDLTSYINGSIQLVQIGERLTLRRVFTTKEVFALQAANPTYGLHFVSRDHVHNELGDPVPRHAPESCSFGEVARVIHDLSLK